MSNIRPFLATLAEPDASPRPFGSALKSVATPPATSPWTPSGSPVPATIDTSAIEDEARERGRQQGLAETAEQRAQLAAAIQRFTTARDALRAPTADQIAAAAAAVITAWTGTAAPAQLYAPIVRAWLDRQAGAATARVAPQHVAAVRELVGDAPIEIVADPALRPGDIGLASSTLELAYSWDRELATLRDAIAAALEETA